jgi:hypothetical protein
VQKPFVRNTGNEIEEKWEINEIERRIGRKLTGIEGSEHSVFFGASEIARGRKFLERRKRNEMGPWVYEVIVSSLDPTVRSPKAVDRSLPQSCQRPFISMLWEAEPAFL